MARKKNRNVEGERRRQLASMDDEFLVCRELMHAWVEQYSYVFHRERGVTKTIMQVFICSRCETERQDRIDARTWELSGRRYVHPDGYLLDHAGFLRRAEVRREKFTRHPVSEEPPGAEKVRTLRLARGNQ